MKQLLILLFTLTTIQSICQPNIDLNTTWTYSFWNLGLIEPDSLYVDGDTIIDGMNWYKLSGDVSCAFTNPDSLPLIREQNSKWIVYDVNRNMESTLYDFSLTDGDSYIIEIFGPNYPIEVNIDSTSKRSINGIERTVQHINLIDFGFEIIEGIGCTSYLFPQGNICDPKTGPIRCFENNLQFIDLDPDRECDETYFPTSTEDHQLEGVNINIFPNPASVNDPIRVNSTTKLQEIKVFTQSGKLIQVVHDIVDNPILQLTDKGIYYLRINTGEYDILKKIIITN